MNADLQKALQLQTEHLKQHSKLQADYQQQLKQMDWKAMQEGAIGVDALMKGLNVFGPALGIIIGKLNEGTSELRFKNMIALIQLLQSGTVQLGIQTVIDYLNKLFSLGDLTARIVSAIFGVEDVELNPPTNPRPDPPPTGGDDEFGGEPDPIVITTPPEENPWDKFWMLTMYWVLRVSGGITVW